MKQIFCLLFLITQLHSAFGQIEQIALRGEKVTSIIIINDGSSSKFSFAGTKSNGFFMHSFNDDDTTWINGFFRSSYISTLFSKPHITTLPVILNRIYFCFIPDSIHQHLIYFNDFPIGSSINPGDNGLNKNEISSVISMAMLQPLDFVPTQILYCCAGNNFIYIWKDSVWEKSWNGNEPASINVLYSNGQTIWAGGTDSSKTNSLLFLKYTFPDTSWTEIHPSIGTALTCYSIAGSYSNPQVMYAGINGEVIKSMDGGLNWDTTSLKVNGVDFTSIVVNPLNSKQVFAGGKDKNNLYVLYKSDDEGLNWEYLMSTYQNCSTRCLISGINTMTGAVVNNEFIILIGTDGDGIFKYSDNPSSVEQELENMNDKYFLYQNYPNPFNPSTRIKFYLLENAVVKLQVFDILGNEIKTLVNEFKSKGSHTINFDGSKLPSGIYFYRLRANEFASTGKMILLK